MAGKVIRKRGEQWPNYSEFSRKVLCWIHTLSQDNQTAARLTKGRSGLLSGHVCDQDVWKAIWERFCVVNLVRSWCQYCREVAIWSGQWLRRWEQGQGSEWCHAVWSALWCGQWTAVKFPQAWGWLNRHRPESRAAQESSWFFRSWPPKKDSLEEGVRDFNLKNL